MRTQLFICMLVVAALAVKTSTAGEDLDFDAWQVTPLPLPFQNLNIAREIVNRTAKPRIAAYPDFQECYVELQDGPNASWRRVFVGVERRFWKCEHVLEGFEAKTALNIEPGQAIRVQTAVNGRLLREDSEYIAVAVTNDAPKSLRVIYHTSETPSAKTIKKTATVHCRKPSHDDAPVVAMLCENAALRRVMMWHEPESAVELENVIPKVEDVIREHPKSGYVNDARFALAIWFRQSPTGVNTTEPRDRKRALQELEAIDVKTFPRGAAVLLLRREMYEEAQRPADALEMGKLLDKLYPDSMERLTDHAWHHSTIEDWQKAGTRKPVKAEPRKSL